MHPREEEREVERIQAMHRMKQISEQLETARVTSPRMVEVTYHIMP